MKFFKEVLNWSIHISLGFVLALIISIFVFQPTSVKGCSMEPTLDDGDKVFVSRLNHTFKIEPEYEDIVIIDSRVSRPRTLIDDINDCLKSNLITQVLFETEIDYFSIKRVIGKPGDILEFRDNKVYRNGEGIKEEYVKDKAGYYINTKVKVPKGCVFVMGDNRNSSTDSRMIGCIPMDHIIGKYKFKF